MTASRSVEVRIPLRWADMDAYGHVNNIAVVQLLEEARVAAFGVPANTGAGGGQAPVSYTHLTLPTIYSV